MITGVTKGYEYKMRLVYAHFPININIESECADTRVSGRWGWESGQRWQRWQQRRAATNAARLQLAARAWQVVCSHGAGIGNGRQWRSAARNRVARQQAPLWPSSGDSCLQNGRRLAAQCAQAAAHVRAGSTWR